MISNYWARPQQYQDISNEGGLTFLNDGGGQRGGCTGGQGRRRGHGFGRRGRGTSDSALRRDESDDDQFLLDRVNDLESDVDAYLDTRNTDMILQQSDRRRPSGWIILDSAYTVCMFSEPGLFKDIHKVQRALTARTVTTNLMVTTPTSQSPSGSTPRVLQTSCHRHGSSNTTVLHTTISAATISS